MAQWGDRRMNQTAAMNDVRQSDFRPAAFTAPRWHLLGMLSVAFMLFMLSNPLDFVIKGILPGAPSLVDPHNSREIYPNVLLQMIVKASVLGAFGLMVLFQVRRGLAVMLRAPLLCFFLLYVICSISWSETPVNSLTDVIYLVTAVTAGTALAVCYGARDVARIFAFTGLMIAIASLIMVSFFPAYGIQQANEELQGDLAGAWRGVFVHKNVLGQMMAAYFVIFLFSGRELLGSRMMQTLALMLSLLLVLASRSASALALLALCTSSYFVLFLLRGMAQFLVLILSPIAILVAANMRDAILSSLNRGPDLSGRTEIWAAAYHMILERPFFGYGYGSASMGGLTAYIITRFKAQNSHSGYIDLALSSGIVGSLLLYGAIGMALYRTVRAWDSNGAHALMIRTFVAYLIGWAIASFTEVDLRPNVPMGALGFLTIVVLSSLPPRQADRHRQFPDSSPGDLTSGLFDEPRAGIVTSPNSTRLPRSAPPRPA
jgi:exopolysaccharide production protein ExoQ